VPSWQVGYSVNFTRKLTILFLANNSCMKPVKLNYFHVYAIHVVSLLQLSNCKLKHTFVTFYVSSTHFVHLIRLNFITPTKSGEMYKSLFPSLLNFLQPLVTSLNLTSKYFHQNFPFKHIQSVMPPCSLAGEYQHYGGNALLPCPLCVL
jgi:hypothetical protein